MDTESAYIQDCLHGHRSIRKAGQSLDHPQGVEALDKKFEVSALVYVRDFGVLKRGRFKLKRCDQLLGLLIVEVKGVVLCDDDLTSTVFVDMLD